MGIRNKIYYPEGQINRGLYTNGSEWMLEDGKEFIGPYHSYTNGEIFTLPSYSATLSKKLIPYVNLSDSTIQKKFEYTSLLKSPISQFNPTVYSNPGPTEKDYANGFYYRYFTKRYFQKLISEVNKDTFEDTKDEFYIKVKLVWKLTGPLNDTNGTTGVSDTNQRLLMQAESKISGITLYRPNYTEWARLSS